MNLPHQLKGTEWLIRKKRKKEKEDSIIYAIIRRFISTLKTKAQSEWGKR